MGETTNLKNVLLISVFLVATTYSIAVGRTIYVDDDGPADFNNIQAAIDNSNYGDTIIIADGTYTGPGNRDIDFRGKAITLRSENGPQNCIINCQKKKGRGFYFHSGESPISILDGFTITNGYLTDTHGGGIYCIHSSPTITNCIIIANSADFGGGMCVYYGRPIVTNCVFRGNSSGWGGGMCNSIDGSPTVRNCIFTKNYSGLGAGMLNILGNPNIVNCIFSENSGRLGGAIHNARCSPTFTNCILSFNSAVYDGGGMFNNESSPRLTNCTISRNYARHGDGIYNEDSSLSLSNCILWGNSGQQIENETSTAYIIYSDVQGGWAGEGNINADPRFVDIHNHDYHLLPGSPCIDTGNNSAVPSSVVTDLEGGPRIRGHAVDMGVYESTVVLFVDADAPGPTHNGSSWATAFKCLQDALADAVSGEEIWVGEGTYRPDQDTAHPGGTGNREATFQLKNGITIKGSYAGFGEPDPNTCDIEAYETILSGDLKDNDREVIDPCEFLNDPCRAENSYHVVTSSGCDETAILDGFTISAGNANGSSPNHQGGGIYNNAGSPTLIHCTFHENSATTGGGMINYYSHSALTNCIFSGNLSDFTGGGMDNVSSTPTLTNCIFYGNYVNGSGSAMQNLSSNTKLVNCTLTGNSSKHGIAMFNYQSDPVATNCIFWNAGSEILNTSGSTIAITYSDVQGGWPGTGNIDTDPCFVDPGYWDTNGIWVEGDYHLMAGSACLDVGDNSAVQPSVLTDLDGNQRIRGPAVDMGVYERPVVLLVDADANGNNDGSSWADAYNYLQDALIVAFSGDKIFVAEGVYNPDKGVGITLGDREATFQLINGVAIKGSYAGFGQIDPNAREVATYETILSGDLNWNDGPHFANNGENSYHVVTGSWTNAKAVLDGFTITAGNANEDYPSPHANGGGIYNDCGSPSLIYCTFIRNSAVRDGGGMFNSEQSMPTLTNCTFTGNLAIYDGGAMCNRTSSPRVINCTFAGNSANHGAAISNWPGSPIVTACTFSGNSAELGGAVFNWDSSPMLTNCIFTSNTANAGGGIFNWHMCSLVLTNCSFIGNLAQSGWSLACDSELQEHPSDIQVANCIFWHEALPLPGQARNPNPTDGAIMVSRTSDLSWTAGPFATSHDVYFGTNNPPPLISNQTATTFDPGTMPENTTYYWRVDELNAWGKTNGTTWRFTTRRFGPWAPLPLPEGVNNSDSADLGTEIYNADNSTISITYSDVHGGWSGEGNMDTDPCFVESGYWDNNDTRDDPEDDVWVEGDYHLLLESPCINAGDPDYIAAPNETDLDGLPRVIGGRIDMGAYEFQNTPPVADAGPDQVVECACNIAQGTKVTLDGTGSYDADGDPLTYTWTGPFVESPAYEATPPITLEDGCPGEYVITLVVNDGIEDSEPNEVVITVVDTTPPEFALSVSPAVLWPPDHKMVLITPSWTVSDRCDASPQVSLVSIVANESDDNIGDGHTSNDIQINEDGSIYLRSERSGTSSDRIYTITCQAVDDYGNTTVRSAIVSIPHDFKVLARIAARWLWSGPAGKIPEDLNGDGIVNLTDFARFAENWVK